jgi:hypothetical protein
LRTACSVIRQILSRDRITQYFVIATLFPCTGTMNVKTQ